VIDYLQRYFVRRATGCVIALAIIAICGVINLGVSLIGSALGSLPAALPDQSNYSPTVVAFKSTSTRPPIQPTENPLRARGCIKWSDVQQNHVGRSICVFGIVKSIQSSATTYTIQFNDDWHAFKIQDWNYNYYYPEVKPGMCVGATGSVVDNVSFLMLLPNRDEGAMFTYPDLNACR